MLDFFIGIIYSPTCQTVVSDPSCFGVLEAGVVAPEEKRPEEAFEPPPAREWQPDNVL